MARPKAMAATQVPPIPHGLTPEPSGDDLVYTDGPHRWRQDKDGNLVYYVRYDEDGNRAEVAYDGRRRR